MGVPKLIPWLVKTFPGSKNLKEFNNTTQDLYIEVNPLAHVAHQTAYAERLTIKEEHQLIIDWIVEVIKYYKPTNMVYIAVDGVIPMAKIQQQKARRYLSSCQLKKIGDYDSTMITPGTNYMIELDKLIREKILEGNLVSSCEYFVYSSHLAEGEGEHKIFKYLREHLPEERHGNIVVYGNDSDLVLIGMALGITKLIIARDTVSLKYLNKKVNKANEENHFNIDNVISNISEVMGEDKISDFIFAASLVGNDFIPRSPIMHNLETSFEAIVEFLKNGSVFEKNALLLYKYLASLETYDNEEEGMPTLGNLRKNMVDANGTKTRNQLLVHISAIHKADKTTNRDEMFRVLWYRKTLRRDMTKADLPCISDMCVQYIRMMKWVYDYYHTGQDSVSWLCYYPYYYAPMFKDLYAASLYLDQNRKQRVKVFNVKPLTDEIRFTVLHQLVAVMPRTSLPHIPEELHPLYDPKSKLYPSMPTRVMEDIQFASAYDKKTNKPFNGTVIFPMASYHDIMSALSKIILPKKVLENRALEIDIKRNNLGHRKPDVEKPRAPYTRGRGRGRGSSMDRSRIEPTQRQPSTRGRGYIPRGR